MTDKVDTLIWFYNDKGRIKNIKLRTEYVDRKAPSIIRLEEDQAFIILMAMRVQ